MYKVHLEAAMGRKRLRPEGEHNHTTSIVLWGRSYIAFRRFGSEGVRRLLIAALDQAQARDKLKEDLAPELQEALLLVAEDIRTRLLQDGLDYAKILE